VGGTVKKRKFKYYDRYQNDNRSDAWHLCREYKIELYNRMGQLMWMGMWIGHGTWGVCLRVGLLRVRVLEWSIFI
jgi:hypothetical protein